jgi:preprotein translocase subunit SecG
LSRSTAIAATVFFASTLALASFSNHRAGAATDQGSALEQAARAATAASGASAAASSVSTPAAPASGAALIPSK